MYTEKQQSSSITVDQAKKTNSSQTKVVKPSHPPTLPLFYKVNSQSLQPLRWRSQRLYGDNWISPKHNFMQHTRVLSCRGPVAANLHFAFLSKRKGKIKKNQAGLFVSKKICVLQVYFTSKSWRQIWWCVNQYFKYTFYHTI